MEILFFQRLSWPCLERRSQCRDVAAERRAEGKDKTHQDAHENYDPGDEIPWRKKLDDGLPESVEEQFLVVLISRQYITKQYIKDVLQADKKNRIKRTYYKTTNRRWINVKKRRFHRKSKQTYIKSSTSDTFTRSYWYILFTQKRFYTHTHTQTLLHTGAFHTQTFFHTDNFTHRRFHTETPLHTDSVTHRHFYT